ncbi:MAG TPA: rod shape-determining protein MreC [Pseudomonadales bacterium]|nr:rod shape-determining protein MreC [Pseudomonadales bacterium]
MALAIVSSLLLTIDLNSRLLQPMRSLLATIVSPIYIVAESPYRVSREARATLSTRESLMAENAQLERRNVELSTIAQQFVALREENARLRQLLGSRQRLGAEVLVAELIGVVPSPNTFQVEIDKGAGDGVFVGQAVIDAEGLFGQVVEVAQFSSRVMLVIDAAHAVPVQVNRNDFRSIAAGTGRTDRLELEYVPVTADIRVGDLLVSSGLGGHFPRGYPVGEVTAVVVDPTMTYAQVTAKPSAALDRSRHVLLVYDSKTEQPKTAEPAPEEAK